MSVKERIGGFVLDKAIDYVSGDPETNIPKLLGWLDSVAPKTFEVQSKVFHEIIDDPNNAWYKFIMDMWKDVDNDLLKSFFVNFAYPMIANYAKNEEKAEKYGHNFPIAMLIDPTSACNLSCKGCWSAEYGDKLNLSYETLDDIVTQGEDYNVPHKVDTKNDKNPK